MQRWVNSEKSRRSNKSEKPGKSEKSAFCDFGGFDIIRQKYSKNDFYVLSRLFVAFVNFDEFCVLGSYIGFF